MNWSEGLAHFDRLRATVDSSVRAVNASVQEVAKDAASSVKDVAKQMSQATNSNELVSKVRDALDIQGAQRGDVAKSGLHFTLEDVTYITPRVIIMGFPETPQQGRSAKSVAALLNARHGDEYMIYNLSEKSYPTNAFLGQVVEFNCPGYPTPPLKLLFEICMAMESWLLGDLKNVVVVHCMTGRGRSAAVVSCLLEWIGSAAKAREALKFVCKMRRAQIDQAMVPSQLRYLSLFHRVLEGERPSYQPLILKRLTLNGVPNMLGTEELSQSDEANYGCRPYLQLYKNGKCVFTTAKADAKREDGTRFASSGEGSSFTLDTESSVIDGDVLLRVRHVDLSTGKGISMFRIGLHSGYLTTGVLKFNRDDLDGASIDSRFPKDLVLELELGVCDVDKDAEPGTSDMFDAAISAQTQDSFWDRVSEKKRAAEQRTPSEIQALVDSSVSLAKANKNDAKVEETLDGTTNAPEFSILDEDEDAMFQAPSSLNAKNVSDMELFDALNALEEEGDIDLGLDQAQTASVSPPAGPTIAHNTGDDNNQASDFSEIEMIERELVGLEEKGSAVMLDQGLNDDEVDDPDLDELERYLKDM